MALTFDVRCCKHVNLLYIGTVEKEPAHDLPQLQNSSLAVIAVVGEVRYDCTFADDGNAS